MGTRNSGPARGLRRRLDELRSGFWLIPSVLVVGSVATAVGLIVLDRYLQRDAGPGWIYQGGPANASDTLTTIASSMITFTALVFSITMVALQLTSSQFSPRALRSFLRDRESQVALGVFVATFAYAIAALSAVRVAAEDDPGFVPSITVTGALVLLAASVVAFVRLIHHTAHSLRAVTIIERIARETRTALEEAAPRGGEAGARPPPVAPGGGGGRWAWWPRRAQGRSPTWTSSGWLRWRPRMAWWWRSCTRWATSCVAGRT